jgi:DNA-binding GntR family transcriptional regulator
MIPTKAVPIINRASLAEQAYVAIKDMILRLELTPGEPITEAQLSSLLQISKSPIRSALIHLQRDGLVTITPYKETIVSALSVEKVRSIYEARLLIEPYVVSVVTPRLTLDDYEQLAEMLRRSEGALATEDFPTFFAINSEFHGFFVHRHGNEFLQNTLQTIDLQMERVRMISATILNHPQKQHTEHNAIFDAVRSGDAEAAGRAMHDHIAGYLDDVLTEVEAGRIMWLRGERGAQ